MVEEEILKDRPVRNGRVMPVEASDFAEKSALFLPKEAQYSYLVNLPEDIPAANITCIRDLFKGNVHRQEGQKDNQIEMRFHK